MSGEAIEDLATPQLPSNVRLGKPFLTVKKESLRLQKDGTYFVPVYLASPAPYGQDMRLHPSPHTYRQTDNFSKQCPLLNSYMYTCVMVYKVENSTHSAQMRNEAMHIYAHMAYGTETTMVRGIIMRAIYAQSVLKN